MGELALVCSIYLEALALDWPASLRTWARDLERIAMRSFNEFTRLAAAPRAVPGELSFAGLDALVDYLSGRAAPDLLQVWMGSYQGRQRRESPLRLGLKLDPSGGCHQLYAEINASSDRLTERPVRELLESFADNASQVGKVAYGLMDIMRVRELPLFYFSDFETDKLTPELLHNLQIWREGKKALASKVRDVYLGNILTHRHFADKERELIDEIVGEVGSQNVAVNNDRAIIALPSTLAKWINEEGDLLNVRERLRALFRRERRLMTAATPVSGESKREAQAGAETELPQLTKVIDRESSRPTSDSDKTFFLERRQALVENVRIQGRPSPLRLEGMPLDLRKPVRRHPLPVVSLEDFFEGNNDEASIGVNLDPHPGLHKFFSVLREIRDRADVQDVLVEIWEVDESDPSAWPFSERVYVLTSESDEDKVLDWFVELSPDGGIEPGYAAGTPPAAPPLRKSHRVWAICWD